MFTGIIEEVGVIKELRTGNGFGNIEIKCRKVLEDTELGCAGAFIDWKNEIKNLIKGE